MGDASPANKRPPHHAADTAGKVPTAGKPIPMRKVIDVTTAMIVRTTVTRATSMMYAISGRIEQATVHSEQQRRQAGFSCKSRRACLWTNRVSGIVQTRLPHSRLFVGWLARHRDR